MSERTLTYIGAIKHGVPKELYDLVASQKRNGQRQTAIYCPLGHEWIFSGKGQAQLEREAREAAERRTESMRLARDAARDQAETAERRRRAAKGQLTKTRKRIANGVCPCCNRHFPNLADHMATKHPTYIESTEGNTAE